MSRTEYKIPLDPRLISKAISRLLFTVQVLEILLSRLPLATQPHMEAAEACKQEDKENHRDCNPHKDK
jgi:hypothetical protein